MWWYATHACHIHTITKMHASMRIHVSHRSGGVVERRPKDGSNAGYMAKGLTPATSVSFVLRSGSVNWRPKYHTDI